MRAVVARLQTRTWFKPGRVQLVGVSESVRGKEFCLPRMGWNYNTVVTWLVNNGYRLLRRDGGRYSGDYGVATFGLVGAYGDPLNPMAYLPQDAIEGVALDYEDEFISNQGGV